MTRGRLHGALALPIVCALAFASTAHAKGPTKAECIRSNEDAQDLQSSGKLREARARLAVCVSTSCPGAVRQDCAQRLNDVEAKIPTLVLEVKTAAGDDVTHARVSEDGTVLTDKMDGTALELDPGEHHLTFDADGQPSLTKTFVLREGEKGRHERVVLGATSSSAAAAQPPAPGGANAPASDADMQRSPYVDHPDEGSTGSGQRLAGLVVLGGGVVGLGLGTAFALSSKSTYDHALSVECNNDPAHCSPQGAADGNTAHSQATFSTIAFIAGGALLATGALLYFTAPSAPVSVEATGMGLRLRGSW